MHKVIITSNFSLGREYEIDENMAALEAADKYGRCEDGEIVSIYEADILIEQARWTPEDGGHYYDCEI